MEVRVILREAVNLVRSKVNLVHRVRLWEDLGVVLWEVVH